MKLLKIASSSIKVLIYFGFLDVSGVKFEKIKKFLEIEMVEFDLKRAFCRTQYRTHFGDSWYFFRYVDMVW